MPQEKKNFVIETAMASFNGKVVLPILLLWFTVTMCAVGQLAPPKMRHIKITNELGGDLALTFHCKSPKRDYGVQVLGPHASSEFSFKPNIWVVDTEVSCNFQWPNESHDFVVFRLQRDVEQCIDCFYNILPNVVCRFDDDTGGYDDCLPYYN